DQNPTNSGVLYDSQQSDTGRRVEYSVSTPSLPGPSTTTFEPQFPSSVMDRDREDQQQRRRDGSTSSSTDLFSTPNIDLSDTATSSIHRASIRPLWGREAAHPVIHPPLSHHLIASQDNRTISTSSQTPMPTHRTIPPTSSSTVMAMACNRSTNN
ncbi:6646_t:CDS:2, partial [Acaulospora colombiana]